MSGNNCDENSEQHPKNKWYNHKPNKFSIAIAFLIIYGFFVLYDAHELWPWSPFAAVAIGIPVTIAVLYAEVFATEAISFRSFLISSAVVFVGGVVLYFFGPAPQQPVIVPVPGPPAVSPRTFEGGLGIPFEDAEVRGVLKPANEPTPPNGCDNAPFPIKPDALKILIGDGAITHNGFGSFTAIGIAACRALSMERRTDGIFVNASLYDQERQRVVSIENNRITALHGENYTAQQSRDESRLTVKGKSGTELFYIRYLNPTTVQFRGFLGCMGGRIVHVQEGQPVPGYFMGHFCFGLLSPQGAGIQIGTP